MATPNPFITFNGNAEEAFNFYKSVFGREFSSVMRWKDMPGSMRSNLASENNFLISLECESKEEVSKLYRALLEGGKEDPMMPLGDAFWGAYAGFLSDRFAVRWMVNHTYPKNSYLTLFLMEEKHAGK